MPKRRTAPSGQNVHRNTRVQERYEPYRSMNKATGALIKLPTISIFSYWRCQRARIYEIGLFYYKGWQFPCCIFIGDCILKDCFLYVNASSKGKGSLQWIYVGRTSSKLLRGLPENLDRILCNDTWFSGILCSGVTTLSDFSCSTYRKCAWITVIGLEEHIAHLCVRDSEEVCRQLLHNSALKFSHCKWKW